jgi:hypothetical protein
MHKAEKAGLNPAVPSLKVHKAVIWTTDFFPVKVWTPFGLVPCYVLVFIQLKTRKIIIARITAHPNGNWKAQTARNLTGWDGVL